MSYSGFPLIPLHIHGLVLQIYKYEQLSIKEVMSLTNVRGHDTISQYICQVADFVIQALALERWKVADSLFTSGSTRMAPLDCFGGRCIAMRGPKG